MNQTRLINRDFKRLLLNSQFVTKPRRPMVLIGATILILIGSGFQLYSTSPIVEPPDTTENNTVSLTLPQEANTPTLPAVNNNSFSFNRSSITPTNKPSKKALVADTTQWQSHTVKSGESLSTIFKHFDLSAQTLYGIINSGATAQQLKNIRPGKSLRFATKADGGFLALEYAIDRVKTLKIYSIKDSYVAKVHEKKVGIAINSASAIINNSLYLDGKQAGLSDKTIMELANIFGWDIDFALSIRQGDSFTLLYETRSIEGEAIENGNILAAEFVNRGETYQAVRFVNKGGEAEYFSPNGKSMRKTFLRSPIDFARISSRFNLRRKHPVLNRIRAHKGVDYAASTGTPIKTTSQGKIVFRGVKGGYGRVVIVQHGQTYSTLYAHMSKYGRLRTGSRVKQGQTVGYVGRSGLATGPHLHYEFRVNGVHRNPLTFKFPAAKPIKESLLAEFKLQTTPLLAKLEQAKQTQLALNLQ
ncbi:MAG: peptidase M23 [Cycloclasticus sp. symbiont of Poecilosclerida sp. M]|nr:MAG: peptidase M23 [Cycloclasticus sp. symbiont of Poecilosclerida sp. M]